MSGRVEGPADHLKAYGRLYAMRTTLDLDDALLEALVAAFPGLSKTDAIEAALAAYLAENAASWLRAQAGSVELDDVSTELRRADRA